MFGAIGGIASLFSGIVGFVRDIIGWNRDQAIKQSGIDEQRGQDLEAQNKVLKDELTASVNSPPDVAAVVDRSRKGGL